MRTRKEPRFVQTWVVVMGVKVAPQRASGCSSVPASSSRHRSVSSAGYARAGWVQ